ncbi:hypothetical protein SpCBS45565_g03239 [Spizellomyces sp. 'palustris']|nr:hypothetical protein SpCBS45565_g03239 [Spizellomyces sp. 'palustris']
MNVYTLRSVEPLDLWHLTTTDDEYVVADGRVVRFATDIVVWATYSEEYDRSPIVTDKLTRADIFELVKLRGEMNRETRRLEQAREQCSPDQEQPRNPSQALSCHIDASPPSPFPNGSLAIPHPLSPPPSLSPSVR